MPLKTFVKINSVNNLSDARYCAGMGVAVMGFNIDANNEGSVTKETFDEIIGWVEGPEFALEVRTIPDHIEEFKASYVEISDEEELFEVQNAELRKILKTPLAGIEDIPFEQFEFLHITGEGTTLNDDQIEALKDLSAKTKVILGFGFSDENLEDILEKTQVHGISITAGDEIRPGYKDFNELADILELLEEDEWA